MARKKVAKPKEVKSHSRKAKSTIRYDGREFAMSGNPSVPVLCMWAGCTNPPMAHNKPYCIVHAKK